MGVEDLGGREAAIVAEQWVHAVTLLVVIDGCLVERPVDVVAATGDLAISGMGSRPTAPRLFEGVLLTHRAAHLDIAANVVVLEDLGDFEVDLGGAAQPGARFE